MCGNQDADHARAQHHQRKGQIEQKQPKERRNSQRLFEAGIERPPANADQRLHHNRQHRCLDSQEQRREPVEIGSERIERGERQHHERTGNDEQQARRKTTLQTVQPPANPCGQLLRFGSGQQMAEIERMEILLLVHPLMFFDNLAVHQRDLPCRAAKAQTADAREHAHQFAKFGTICWFIHGHKHISSAQSRASARPARGNAWAPTA